MTLQQRIFGDFREIKFQFVVVGRRGVVPLIALYLALHFAVRRLYVGVRQGAS